MGDYNLDLVAVELPPRPTSKEYVLDWTLDHFDKDKTKLILIPHTDPYCGDRFRNAANISFLPRCTEKKFRAEVLIPNAIATPDMVQGFRLKVVELITKHRMTKLVFPAADWTISQTLKALDEIPKLSCKIWFVDQYNGNLISTRCYDNGNEVMITETLMENEKLKKMLNEESRRREDALVEIEKLKKMVKEEISGREKVEKELLTMIEPTKTNKQEIEGLRREIDQLKENKALTTTFSFQELEEATKIFSDSLKIGEGESGSVYKGIFRGTTVAIKKFNAQSKPSLSIWKQEVVVLSTVRHPNLVTLIGVCSEPPALVYEFLSRGTLRNYLDHAGNTTPLSWQVRTRIIGEVCVALIFLHSNKPNPIIHGDLRPDNILLDANFTSKLSDFGLIKQGETDTTNLYPAKTLAYMDPEYLTAPDEKTKESDVYSFGVLILHLLTGRSRLRMSKYVEETIKNDKFRTTIDESAGKWPLHHAEELAKLGVLCADAQRSKRPDLVKDVWPVVERLVKIS
ncbi:hypothetical protein LUZ60_009220 [Juncus effusus]|nr:hypothetical protein LUZ60_009220 [Juncus effusus]